jgi:hypothetical protein
MTIGEAFVQFRSEFHLGNICHAIGNFFQNIKSSLGNKETSNAMGSAPTCSETPVSRDAQLASILGIENKSVGAFESPERVSWFEAHNQEVKDLTSRAGPEMKAFFEGPTPTVAQTHDPDNMTLEEAREFLGIKDGEETRLDANERGGILKMEANKIFLNIPESSSDQRDKFHYMELKIQRAMELVENSNFSPIPEPKVDA